MNERTFKKGDIVQHFKREKADVVQEPNMYLYEIVGIAGHTETEEKLMIYKALYGTKELYARPLSMFLEETDHEKYPEYSQEYRFEKYEGVVFNDKVHML